MNGWLITDAVLQGLLDKHGRSNDKTPKGWKEGYQDLSAVVDPSKAVKEEDGVGDEEANGEEGAKEEAGEEKGEKKKKKKKDKKVRGGQKREYMCNEF